MYTHTYTYTHTSISTPSLSLSPNVNSLLPSTLSSQMNNGMIHGSDVTVEAASEENGFFELPPEAAKNPWAQIGM